MAAAFAHPRWALGRVRQRPLPSDHRISDSAPGPAWGRRTGGFFHIRRIRSTIAVLPGRFAGPHSSPHHFLQWDLRDGDRTEYLGHRTGLDRGDPWRRAAGPRFLLPVGIHRVHSAPPERAGRTRVDRERPKRVLRPV